MWTLNERGRLLGRPCGRSSERQGSRNVAPIEKSTLPANYACERNEKGRLSLRTESGTDMTCHTVRGETQQYPVHDDGRRPGISLRHHAEAAKLQALTCQVGLFELTLRKICKADGRTAKGSPSWSIARATLALPSSSTVLWRRSRNFPMLGNR